MKYILSNVQRVLEVSNGMCLIGEGTVGFSLTCSLKVILKHL